MQPQQYRGQQYGGYPGAAYPMQTDQWTGMFSMMMPMIMMIMMMAIMMPLFKSFTRE